MIRFASGSAALALAMPVLAMIVAFGAADVRAQSAASNAAAIDALSKKVTSMGAGSGGMGGVAKGVDGVNLKISGQISRSVLYVQDGINGGKSAITYVDNDHVPTYVRWDADTRINAGWTTGAVLEMEMQSNSSFLASPTGRNTDNPNRNPDGDTFSAHHGLAYVWVNGPFGMIRTGQIALVTDHILTTGFHHAVLADIEPAHGYSNSQASLRVGVTVDASDRQDGIRYDTPIWKGFQLSAHSITTGQIGIRGKYDGRVAGLGVRAALSYREISGTGNYRPPGPSGPPGTPTPTAEIPDRRLYQGAAGIDFGPVAANGGFIMTNQYLNGAMAYNNQFYYYFGLAHRGNYLDMGPTSIAVDYDRLNFGDRQRFDLRFGSLPSSVVYRSSTAIGVVQQLTPGVDIFASFRHLFNPRKVTGDLLALNTPRPGMPSAALNTFNSATSAQIGMMGMRVRF